uniref:Allene oxide synthase n=1 Tax=Rhizophora mucronata TaxID=61149 RepID=A0A2P2MAV0_RHIMU
MASSSLALPSLQPQFPLQNRQSSRPFVRPYSSVRPITASVSESPKVPASSASVARPPEPTKLPIREVPGDYGLPIIGPIKDRNDYFYTQGGRDEFFKSKIKKYQSTVFKTNMPPGPFIASNPQVVALLDGKSFPVLFDVSKVEKRDVFTGTYVPSLELTGGYRVLSYLDPSEPHHGKLKKIMFHLLKSSRDRLIPEFSSSYNEMFETLEKEITSKGKASFGDANDQAAFNFLARSLFGTNPADTELGRDGPSLITKWTLFQLGPILTIGLPKFIEEPLLHSNRLPPCLVKKDYQRLYDFFYSASGTVLEEAAPMGVSREEACHNIIFATCFNSFGGFKLFFPNMLKWLGRGGVKLHAELAQEIRSVVKSNGGKVSMAAMEQMPLMKSVVYEALRIDPPVPLQYGRAKRDLVIESHNAAFKVKEGQMLFGFQPFATRDPKIFERAEEFVADRFVGEEGEKMLKHVLWSNGPETESPTVENKQTVRGERFRGAGVQATCRGAVFEIRFVWDRGW